MPGTLFVICLLFKDESTRPEDSCVYIFMQINVRLPFFGSSVLQSCLCQTL